VSIESFRHFTPQVHPEAWVHGSAVLIGEVELAEGVTIWPGVVLRGDMGAIRIGARSNIQDNSVVHMTSGHSITVVGERVTVGHRALLHGCRVGNDCLIGMGSILLDNAVIPDGCIVGAGSLVTGGKTFEPGSLILGSPARSIRPLGDKDYKQIHYSWNHYLETAEHYRNG
jgi:carbonic anhydrase/acetyltransferase-like protein (isoleucine patch superfamily)